MPSSPNLQERVLSAVEVLAPEERFLTSLRQGLCVSWVAETAEAWHQCTLNLRPVLHLYQHCGSQNVSAKKSFSDVSLSYPFPFLPLYCR